MLAIIKNEKSLFVSLIALFVLYPFEHDILFNSVLNSIALAIIFGVIMYSALNVAHHAEMLAEKYGEPYGTLILTTSAVLVEVLMIGIMMSHSENINLARDTIVSAIILDINGLLGIAAVIGGIKHGQQNYNFHSTDSYVAMIVVALGTAMIMPLFIKPEYMYIYMVFSAVMFVFMYVVFTRIQTKEHAYFFKYDYKSKNKEAAVAEHLQQHKKINGGYHFAILIASIVVIGFLSELLSVFMSEGLSSSGLPLALGAFTVAVISAAPELLTAINAAVENRMQTVINIALGASLSTVLLTIPAMIILALFTDHAINFGLTNIQMVLLGMTLLVSIINFNDGKSNVLEGSIHLIIFIVFVFLLFTDHFA